MERITYFLICQDVLSNDKEQIIRNPIYLMTPLNIPGNFSFTVAMGVANLKENGQYKIVLEIVDPESNVKKLIDANFTTPPKSQNHDKQIFEGNLNFGYPNFEFYKEGIFRVIVNISSETVNLRQEAEFMVKKKLFESV